MSIKRTCYDTMYPFFVVSKHALTQLDFAPVTILYGGNGSGKTTALNLIAETLGLQRDTLYNRSSFFGDYTALCRYSAAAPLPKHSRVITSDDVFEFILDIRHVNEGIDRKREDLFEEWADNRYGQFRLRSLDDYEQLKKTVSARRKTQSKYVRENLAHNVREHSNGETAYLYFTDKVRENGLYLLDEPENSLSPPRQQELLRFLEESARFFGCQFVIATHSPFLLSLRGAKIYDMDEDPVDVKRWTDLPSVRAYYEFFRAHYREFEEKP